MARVVFMCGAAGSGKTAVARRLEADHGFVRLSIDEQAWIHGYRSMPLPPAAAAAIEAGLRARLLDLVARDRDVVLDFSFWSRTMREAWRSLLRPAGSIPETIYLDTDRATALDRVRRRTAAGPDSFPLPDDVAAAYCDGLEPPTAEEGPLTVVRYRPDPPNGPEDAKA